MITNEQTALMLEEYYDRGVLRKEIRSYEVSLWTLQDDFITVLKWSDVEQKGRIEEPKMILNVDGTQKLSFSIPMYYRFKGELIENPNWYNTLNGNLITGLRKLKVIFNKGEFTLNEASDHIFEFVITNVTESHDKDVLTCELEAEGLAFQELGKIGYKITLSLDNFEIAYEKWATTGSWIKSDGTTSTTMPLLTVDYWCEETGLLKYPGANVNINPRAWYYDVQMNWKTFENGRSGRLSDKIYEESYASSWNDDLQPLTSESYKEKARAVKIEHSNIYNITQTIAETFEVFCRYKYLYNENYQIVGRIIVFYNNFIQDDPSKLLTLTYPYSSSKVERTMDSTAVTSKLFVLNVEDNTTAQGYHSIMNAPPNASREEYILNFDYLYGMGAISKEQYESIEPYRKEMRQFNNELIILLQLLASYNTEVTDLESKLGIVEKSLTLNKEQIAQNNKLKIALDAKDGSNDGKISLTKDNPDYCIITNSTTEGKYVNFAYTNKGIDVSTLRVYKTSADADTDDSTRTGLITSYKPNYDEETGNLLSITFTNANDLVSNNVAITHVYLIYDYDPHLYYDKIIKVWEDKDAKDNTNRNEYLKLLGPKSATDVEFDVAAVYPNRTVESVYNDSSIHLLRKLVNVTKEQIEVLVKQKNKAIQKFELLMGPAIREGYWQPENYNDYGDYKTASGTMQIADITADSGNGAIIAWDTKAFDDEDKLYFLRGIGGTKYYYPIVNLDSVFPNGVPTDLDKYSIVWKANNRDASWDSAKDLLVYTVGSSALFRFMRINMVATPVLVVVGAKSLTATEIGLLTSTGRLEKYTTTVNSNGSLTISHGNSNVSLSGKWIIDTNTLLAPVDDDVSDRPMLYPRIKFSSLDLKTSSSNFFVTYNNSLLEVGKDYLIRTRDTKRTVNSDILYFPEYYMTIKPESLLSRGLGGTFNINYVISNANTAIYLDAVKVSLENAWPKVSYNIATNLLDTHLTKNLYKSLAQIVMVNDTDLKFQNVFGYISLVELDLDNEANDTVEIKNYKTKFEDLFSTIVALTEAMKLMTPGVEAAISGNAPVTSNTFNNLLNSGDVSILNEYLDSHFDSSLVVKDRLTKIFTDAAEILSFSNKALNSMLTLTLENADILSKFALNVLDELTVKVTRSPTKPESFKTGDIWILTDDLGNEIGRYVSTSNSANVTDDKTGSSGFVRTYDGTLASITGAALNVNADDGLVDIEALNLINIKSGNNIYIAANSTVEILGNDKVNIGGTEINLCTLYEKELDPITGQFVYKTDDQGLHITRDAKGINLITGEYHGVNYDYGSTSRILINPEGIRMGAAELEFKAASLMNFITSTGNTANTSALHVSAEDGIWIGTGTSQGVRLFGGEVKLKNDGSVDTTITNANGASVELNSEHLILGYANTFNNNATAIELTETHVIIAAGGLDYTAWKQSLAYAVGAKVVYNTEHYTCKTAHTSGTTFDDNKWTLLEVTGKNGLIGARFTKNSIGFATQITENNKLIYNAFIMNNGGIMVASDESQAGIDLVHSTAELIRTYFNETNKANGSFVRIASSGIELGSLADLYVNTSNFKLLTHSREKGQGTSSNNQFYNGHTIMAIGNDLNGVDDTTYYDTASGQNKFKHKVNGTDIAYSTLPQVSLLLNGKGLFINGNIYATDGIFSGKLVASSLYLRDSNGNDTLWDTYWYNTPLSYMHTVHDTLQGLFELAGTILVAANQSLADVTALGVANGEFLKQFYENVKDNMTPNTYRGVRTTATRGGVYFKTGDVWIIEEDVADPIAGVTNGESHTKKVENTYVATNDWDLVYDTQAKAILGASSHAGWTLVLDGRLAGIEGGSIYHDSKNGILEIKQGQSMTLLCKGKIDITGNDVSITGNKTLKLGGPSIELASYNALGNLIDSTAGITLMASHAAYTDANGNPHDAGTSTVKMTTKGIELASAEGIVIKSGSGIDVYASTGANGHTSAVQINLEGITLGTNKTIDISSNGSNVSGSNFLMTLERILIGVTGIDQVLGFSATAIDISNKEILLATGLTNATGPSFNSFTDKIENLTIAGVQIRADYIGMATGTGYGRSLISMAPGRILMGVGVLNTTNSTMSGGYVKIATEYPANLNPVSIFEIGSTGIFRVLNPYVHIQNDSDEMFKLAVAVTTNGVTTANPKLTFSKTNGLTIEGNVTATTLLVGNTSTNQYMLYTGGTLTVKGDITANTLLVGDTATNQYMQYSGNTLTVKGDITANSLTVGNYMKYTSSTGLVINDLIISSNSENNAASASGEEDALTAGRHFIYMKSTAGSNYLRYIAVGRLDLMEGLTKVYNLYGAKWTGRVLTNFWIPWDTTNVEGGINNDTAIMNEIQNAGGYSKSTMGIDFSIRTNGPYFWAGGRGGSGSHPSFLVTHLCEVYAKNFYVVTSDTSSYTTKLIVATESYVNSAINDMATKTWVSNTALSSYATQTWVNNKGYLVATTAASTYVPQSGYGGYLYTGINGTPWGRLSINVGSISDTATGNLVRGQAYETETVEEGVTPRKKFWYSLVHTVTRTYTLYVEYYSTNLINSNSTGVGDYSRTNYIGATNAINSWTQSRQYTKSWQSPTWEYE